MLIYNNTDIELIPNQCYIAKLFIEEGPWKGQTLPKVYTKYLGNNKWNGMWKDLKVCQLKTTEFDPPAIPTELYRLTILKPVVPKTKIVLNHVER